MTPDAAELAELSHLLDEALDLPSGDVLPWLEALPARHQHLRPHLQQMLARHRAGASDGFLADGPRLDAVDPSEPRVGEHVGPYVLIRELGHGGMGTVWLAERFDGALKRQVALKLPRVAWGAGLARRMARERDIVAQLEHPHISRLYDAGVDAQGRPYLALEFIDGVPIDSWCDQRGLGVRDRLRLFVQVVRTVAYAHARLIVHRDLKPSNVLVTSDAQVHLLDFGIARLLLDAAQEEATALTLAHGRVLTLRYASPEQIEGGPVAVASDVYSLGVLLFELLTHRYPHEPERASLGALEDAVLHGEPALASHRVTQDKALMRALKGDIDAILSKALKRAPQDRYASADAFADDIERLLEGRPVRARPDGRWYRMRKAVLRHRVVLAAAAMVLVVAVAGGAATLMQAKRTAAQAMRAQLATEFVSELFKAHSAPASGSSDLLSTGAQLISTRFEKQPDMQAELYGLVGRIYSDLGASAAARDLAVRQISLLERLPEDRVRRVRALLLLAEIDMNSDRVSEGAERANQAVQLARGNLDLWLESMTLLATLQQAAGKTDMSLRSIAIANKAIANQDLGPSIGLARLLSLQSSFASGSDRYQEAKVQFERAVDAALRSEGPNSPTATEIRLRRAYDIDWEDRPESMAESETMLGSVLDALKARGDAGKIRAAVVAGLYWSKRGDNHRATSDQVIRVVEESWRVVSQSSAIVPPVVRAKVEFYLAEAYSGSDLRRAARLFDDSVKVLTASQIPAGELREVLVDQALLAEQVGKYDEADVQLRAALALANEAVGKQEKQRTALMFYWEVIALNLSAGGSWDAAEAFLDAQELPARPTGGDGSWFRYMDFARAQIKLDRGDPRAAALHLPDFARLTDFERGTAWRLSIYGEIECAIGDKAKGLAYLRKAFEDAAVSEGENSADTATLHSKAGLCALASGDRALASALAREARRASTANAGAAAHFMAPLLKLERALESPDTRVDVSRGLSFVAQG